MCPYKHLSINERESLLILIKSNKSITEISKVMGRSKSTISRELKRNSGENGYSCVQAQERYHERRKACKRHRLFENESLKAKVLELFQGRQWSPEQISHRLKLESSPFQLSYSTIYRGIYDHTLEPAPLPPGQRGLARLLRHKGRTRNTKDHEENRGRFPISHPIEDRPKEAEDRNVIGYIESDTVLGKAKTGCLLTNVDMATRFLFAKKIPAKRSDCVNQGFVELFRDFPKGFIKSFTPDQGNEFKKHALVTEALGVEFYFPPSHSPWFRGTNENTNGLLREYFPKGFDFSRVSDDEIQQIIFTLNTRPRKCLNWLTPFELFFHYSLHLT